LKNILKPSLKKLGILLMIAGLVVVLYVPSTWLWGYVERWGLQEDFNQEVVSSLSANQELLGQLEDQAELEQIKQLAIAAQAELSTEKAIALLEIPKIGVNSVVVEGTDEGSLRKGVGHLEETMLPGRLSNFAIAGDRVLWGGPFLNLDDLAPGDEIKLKTTYAEFAYVVTSSVITVPEDTSVLGGIGKDEITMITCDPIWSTTNRLIVKGELVTAKLLEEQQAG
jgi:sortase A